MTRKIREIEMRKITAAVCSALVLTVAGCGGGDGQALSAGDSRTASIRQEMVTALNAARSTPQICGTTPMPAVNATAWNNKLAVAALRHSADMASHAAFSHTGTDGSTVGTRITQAGYTYRAYGENIAVGYPTVANVVQGWMNSPGHCLNIMNGVFTEIGAAYDLGMYNGSSEMRYWTLDLASQ
jgi:uncharacterized protein YkwD